MKPIPNFPDYFADKKGNIWSKKPLRKNAPIPKQARRLKFTRDENGYLLVILYYKKKGFARRIHCLILETFVGPCPKGYWARHLDGIKAHNELSNLKWDTPSNNCKDRKKHGTQVDNRGEKHGKSKLTNIKVKEIRKLLKEKQLTQEQIGKMFDVKPSIISYINTGKNWGHVK